MDSFDRRLVQRLQRGLPLEAHPFAQIAEELNVEEDELLRRITALREEGIIREIAGVFNAAALGFASALIALEVPERQIDRSGTLLAEYPRISHAYRRDGAMNLWFTLLVPKDDAGGIEKLAQEIADRCNATRFVVLPSIKRYKLKPPIGDTPNNSAPPPASPIELDAQDRRIGAALQEDLPAKHDAFAALAESAGFTLEEFLRRATSLERRGVLRRYAALLNHRRIGCVANVLVAWKVPDGISDRVGRQCAGLDAVSHCILRQTAPNWDYNLYTMIHGRSEQECANTIDRIQVLTEIRNHVELPTLREYVKRRSRIF